MPKYDIDKEMGRVKRKLGHHNKLTAPPSTYKEFKKRLDGMATEAQQRKFIKDNPTFTKPKKKGGSIKRKRGGVAKKHVGGLPQGYNARLDESLAARHPAVRGNLAARRAESEGMERALGRGPYSGARTMAKKGGTVSRKRGSKIMQGYKAGGKV